MSGAVSLITCPTCTQLDFSLCLTLASALSLWFYLTEKQSRFLPWLCPAPCPAGLVLTQRSLMVPGQVSACEDCPHGASVTAPYPVTSAIREAQRGLAPPPSKQLVTLLRGNRQRNKGKGQNPQQTQRPTAFSPGLPSEWLGICHRNDKTSQRL